MVAAWFSTGLICHPIKKRTALVDTEWESASLLCSSKKDGEDKTEKQSDWQIRQEREHLWITGSCNKREEREDVGRKQMQNMKKRERVNGFQLGRRRGRKVKTGKIYVCVCVCVCVCLVEGVALRLSSSVVVFKSRLVC